ncbi:hypothetical protein [Mesorhizobium sp. IMUNJ 23232]|uniref:hypothetical protein n=1 Tax=Mesorhizobium sp. IMUNJ 23232 TaxID=3376064 RepID=UPI0037B6FECB
MRRESISDEDLGLFKQGQWYSDNGGWLLIGLDEIETETMLRFARQIGKSGRLDPLDKLEHQRLERRMEGGRIWWLVASTIDGSGEELTRQDAFERGVSAFESVEFADPETKMRAFRDMMSGLPKDKHIPALLGWIQSWG